MRHPTASGLTLALLVCLAAPRPGIAGGPPDPPVLVTTVSNALEQLEWTPYPAADAFLIESAPTVFGPYTNDPRGQVQGYTWTAPVTQPHAFQRLRVNRLSDDALLTSIVLNRLAYSPTPDDLQRVWTGPNPIGPQAYIDEQLAPETIPDDLDAAPGAPTWQLVTMTGVASGSTFYLTLDAPGDVYVAGLRLVKGTNSAVGTNLIRDGDFQTPLGATWHIATNLAPSGLNTNTTWGGTNSLHLVATSAGYAPSSAVWQTLTPSLSVGQTYTLSYWYLPSTNGDRLTVGLNGSAGYKQGLNSTHHLVPSQALPAALYAKLTAGAGTIDDLRAWHLLHAVRGQRQLVEVLTQFCDNHFTTQYTKTYNYIAGLITNRTDISHVSTAFRFHALDNWQRALLDPNTTFYDLLKISAQSPAMVIYLDTVTSTGGNPNENYARELMELFTMGVDNGYDQTDIEQMARVWTGWGVEKVPPGEQQNPFAPRVANRNSDPGVWTLHFTSSHHDSGAKAIFKNKTCDTRFGPPYAGHSYELDLPARTGNGGMQDGDDVLQHLANLPYTQEFICAKLCRLLVHENFVQGAYDYSNPSALSPEGQLVHQCMLAWERTAADGRQGNLRQVLRAIFSSDLFRHDAAAQQKAKTPLKFVVSVVRQLRAVQPGGGVTADTDGSLLALPLTRLNMPMFERVEPDGWSDYGRDWISSASLVERMRFAEAFLVADRDPFKAADLGVVSQENHSDPVGLLKLKLPPSAWREAGAVADYFLGLFFPGEGRANLDLDRANALAVLDADDTGRPNSSPFVGLDPGSPAYDARVRGLVAWLMGLGRFQEE